MLFKTSQGVKDALNKRMLEESRKRGDEFNHDLTDDPELLDLCLCTNLQYAADVLEEERDLLYVQLNSLVAFLTYYIGEGFTDPAEEQLVDAIKDSQELINYLIQSGEADS